MNSGSALDRAPGVATTAENLKVEGLFRIGGNQKTINELKDKVDKSGGPIDLRNNKVHVRVGAVGVPRRTSPLRLGAHATLGQGCTYFHWPGVGRTSRACSSCTCVSCRTRCSRRTTTNTSSPWAVRLAGPAPTDAPPGGRAAHRRAPAGLPSSARAQQGSRRSGNRSRRCSCWRCSCRRPTGPSPKSCSTTCTWSRSTRRSTRWTRRTWPCAWRPRSSATTCACHGARLGGVPQPRTERLTRHARTCGRCGEPRSQKLPKANDKDADWQPPTVPVLQLMIECHSLLWKVPVDLQIQIDEVVARRNERQRQS